MTSRQTASKLLQPITLGDGKLAARTTVVTLVLLMSACSKGGSGAVSLSPDGQVLTRFLSNVTLANPAKDVDAALIRGDRRFLGINGLTCFAPGVPETSSFPNATTELNCIPGTSDVLVVGEESLRKKTYAYAEAYNRELKARLSSASPKN